MGDPVVAMHQPNFIPWLGFFHKLAHADTFTLLDTVQFSDGSYTDRVGVRSTEGAKWLTVPVKHHFGEPIQDVAIAEIDAVPPMQLAASKSSTPVLRVVYVGGINPIRGTRELILTTRMLQAAVELHLAGPVCESHFLGELESMLAWRYCRYHGWLDWQGSIALVKTCNVGACVLQAAPNHVESLPLKVLEKMACGRGSIVSSFPLWRRLFVGAALFVGPTKPASIARLMEQLIAEPALLCQLSERGRLLAETRYSWECEAQRLGSGYAGLRSATRT